MFRLDYTFAAAVAVVADDDADADDDGKGCCCATRPSWYWLYVPQQLFTRIIYFPFFPHLHSSPVSFESVICVQFWGFFLSPVSVYTFCVMLHSVSPTKRDYIVYVHRKHVEYLFCERETNEMTGTESIKSIWVRTFSHRTTVWARCIVDIVSRVFYYIYHSVCRNIQTSKVW